jgi:hypothetical protein
VLRCEAHLDRFLTDRKASSTPAMDAVGPTGPARKNQMSSSMVGVETTALYRDHVIDWSKDLGRTIDYIETRKDLDHEKLAYYGLDDGAYPGGIAV